MLGQVALKMVELISSEYSNLQELYECAFDLQLFHCQIHYNVDGRIIPFLQYIPYSSDELLQPSGAEGALELLLCICLWTRHLLSLCSWNE
jgi:hypothetical protein